MNTAHNGSPDGAQRRRAAGMPRIWLQRRWTALRAPLRRMRKSRRTRRARRGVDERRRWRPSRPLVKIVKVVSFAGVILLLALIIASLYSVIRGKPSGDLAYVDASCDRTNFSCTVLAGTLGPLLSLALASALFLLVRLWIVDRPYRRKARNESHNVVQTAGSMIGKVVGRDQLCT
jgi:hypothetical protein